MNVYAVSLLQPKELEHFQNIIVTFFLYHYKDMFNQLQVESKRTQNQEQQKLRCF